MPAGAGLVCTSLTAVTNELQPMVTLRRSTDSTATLTVTFSNYNIFTGGAQNFTITVRKHYVIVQFNHLSNSSCRWEQGFSIPIIRVMVIYQWQDIQ